MNFLYNTALSLVKLSVLIFYVRIFRTVETYRVGFWVAGFFIVGWWIGIDLLAILSCIPVQKAWNPTIPGHCLDTQHNFLGATITNIIIDIVLLVLPMPMLWQLHIRTSRKVGLVGVFACGYWWVSIKEDQPSMLSKGSVVILSCLRLASVAVLGASLKDDISCQLSHSLEPR